MQQKELRFEIEHVRGEMNRLAKQYPLFSDKMLAKSRQLDQLINQYQQIFY